MSKWPVPLQVAAFVAVFVLVLNRQSLSAMLVGDIDYDPAVAGPVELYSTSWCGYCRKSRNFLTDKGVAFNEYDIEQSSAARARFDELGGRGVPLLAVGDSTVSGYRPQAFRDAIEGASQPRQDTDQGRPR